MHVNMTCVSTLVLNLNRQGESFAFHLKVAGLGKKTPKLSLGYNHGSD